MFVAVPIIYVSAEYLTGKENIVTIISIKKQKHYSQGPGICRSLPF